MGGRRQLGQGSCVTRSPFRFESHEPATFTTHELFCAVKHDIASTEAEPFTLQAVTSAFCLELRSRLTTPALSALYPTLAQERDLLF